MTALVLLPGLDGTGQLMQPFIEALGPGSDIHVVAYPADRVLDYDELVTFVRSHLPRKGSYAVVAESFSGPVGCALAASRPEGLVGLVLCASFATTPLPVLRRVSFLLRFAPVRAVPATLLATILLGRWSTPSLVNALKVALHSVSPRVLRARAQSALNCSNVESSLDRIQVPVLYLQAEADRLIPRSASTRLRQAIPSARVISIEGPHFLLQAAPAACAAAIQAFVRSVAPERQPKPRSDCETL